jgi:hypothetical protein
MAVGFIMCIAGGSVPGLVYAGVFIAACALYPALPGNITWLSNNLAGSTKRAAGQAIQIAVGNLAGGKISSAHTVPVYVTDFLQPWLPTSTVKKTRRGIF